MKFPFQTVIIILLSAFLLTACTGGNYDSPVSKSCTVLVYLAADNNLSVELTKEVEAIRKGWTDTNIASRCLIYIDSADQPPYLLSLRGGQQTGMEAYVDTIAVYEEENSASAKVFSRIIDDMVKRYPADRYGLIVASHASGWLPEGTLAKPNRSRSIGIDTNVGISQDTNTEMELSDFAEAIPDKQFDFIIFEACLMAGVEVVYELRDKTDYILASSAELLVPGFVPVYPVAFKYLFEAKYSVEQSLKALAQTYYNQVNAQSGVYRSTTLSVIKTRDMEKLATHTQNIIKANGGPYENPITTLQHFDRPGSYGDIRTAPRYFDFMDYMQCIASAEQYVELESIMDRVVIWKAATETFMEGYNGFAIKKHSGMTTYIEQECFGKLNEAYKQTSWYRYIYN